MSRILYKSVFRKRAEYPGECDGEVAMPGTYTLPSLATLFHALYNAGGVGEIGSMRNITVNRKGKVVADVDVYDYL